MNRIRIASEVGTARILAALSLSVALAGMSAVSQADELNTQSPQSPATTTSSVKSTAGQDNNSHQGQPLKGAVQASIDRDEKQLQLIGKTIKQMRKATAAIISDITGTPTSIVLGGGPDGAAIVLPEGAIQTGLQQPTKQILNKSVSEISSAVADLKKRLSILNGPDGVTGGIADEVDVMTANLNPITQELESLKALQHQKYDPAAIRKQAAELHNCSLILEDLEKQALKKVKHTKEVVLKGEKQAMSHTAGKSF